MESTSRAVSHYLRIGGERLPIPDLVRATDSVLSGVRLAAWRMGLTARGGGVPLAVLRGAFGAALHDLSLDAYEEVFRPDEADGAPAYLLRRSAHRMPDRSIFEMVLFDRALPHLEVILDAMRLAGERGLGRDRRTYGIDRLAWLDPWGRPSRDRTAERAFKLDLASWPLAGDPANEPCRLFFPEPVRILRKHVLVERPTLRDLVVAGCRRLAGLVSPDQRVLAHSLQGAGLDVADSVASQPFVGTLDSLGRWSATQQQYMELHGVTGFLDLPEGPGAVWRLLAAMQWVHCGKATVVGLGRLVVLPIW